ncbi:MAG: Holliday junction resolvase RuvX [Spartobacteria bacterium]
MKRIMGIDYGTARIGVALSDELQMLAHPAETIAVAQKGDPAARIAAIVREKEVEQIVVGLPRHMNGSEGVSAEKAREFAEKLKKVVSCEVRTWDERLSTVAAHRSLREAGKSSRQTRGIVDQVAAQHLLQGYLDSLAHNQGGLAPDPFA